MLLVRSDSYPCSHLSQEGGVGHNIDRYIKHSRNNTMINCLSAYSLMVFSVKQIPLLVTRINNLDMYLIKSVWHCLVTFYMAGNCYIVTVICISNSTFLTGNDSLLQVHWVGLSAHYFGHSHSNLNVIGSVDLLLASKDQ